MRREYKPPAHETVDQAAARVFDEPEFRRRWADYFDARAAKSEENAAAIPQHRQVWLDKATIEHECAMVLRMLDHSLPELLAALKKPVPPTSLT
jgi:hypothetical protein